MDLSPRGSRIVPLGKGSENLHFKQVSGYAHVAGVQAHQFEKLLCKLLNLECPLKVGYLIAP